MEQCACSINKWRIIMEKKENPVMKLTGKIVKRDVRVIEQGWPPMCVGELAYMLRHPTSAGKTTVIAA